MNKRLAFILLIFISSAFFSFYLGMNYRDVRYSSPLYQKESSNSTKIFEVPYKYFNKARFKYENGQVFPESVLIRENGEEKSIKSIVGRGKFIVFNFSESNCDICAENELKKIKNIISNKTYTKNILVLTDFNDPYVLTIFKERLGLEFEIFNSKKSPFLNELGNPFYFILDSDYILKDLFIPSKEMPDITLDYFDVMNRKHFNFNPK